MANENVLEVYPYTLSRGKLLVKKEGESNWLDLCNVKECKVTIETEQLDHEKSRSGLKRIDKSTITKQNAKGSFILDVPLEEHLLLFFMGDVINDVSQTSGSLSAQAVTVVKNRWSEVTKENINASGITVTHTSGSPTYVENVDYKLDRMNGLIAMIEGGAITTGDVIKISGGYGAQEIKKILAGKVKNQKRHIWFLGDPAEGKREQFKGYANIIPSGDFSMIGDEWQEFSFELKFEDHTSYSAIVEMYTKGVAA